MSSRNILKALNVGTRALSSSTMPAIERTILPIQSIVGNTFSIDVMKNMAQYSDPGNMGGRSDKRESNESGESNSKSHGYKDFYNEYLKDLFKTIKKMAEESIQEEIGKQTLEIIGQQIEEYSKQMEGVASSTEATPQLQDFVSLEEVSSQFPSSKLTDNLRNYIIMQNDRQAMAVNPFLNQSIATASKANINDLLEKEEHTSVYGVRQRM